jgi:hypothetical protein
MRLVIEIQAVTDQFFEINLGRTFKAPVTASPVASAVAAISPIIARSAPLAFAASAAARPAWAATLTAWPTAAPLIARLGLLLRSLVRLLVVVRHSSPF